ncbi:MAG: hypothetical protein LBK55_06150 [Azoarcus sp.]|jgi:hypothetical protein|nr:hypothetical protein [Azoarcus sp.]
MQSEKPPTPEEAARLVAQAMRQHEEIADELVVMGATIKAGLLYLERVRVALEDAT